MKTQFRYTLYVLGLLLITMLFGRPDTVSAQSALYDQSAFNAGGELQTGGDWSLLSSIGEPMADVAFGNNGDDILWTGFPVILPVGVPSGVREERIPGSSGENRIQTIYPNPFGSTGRIEFTLARAGYVRLTVYDVMGRERAVLVQGMREAGTIAVQWKPENLDAGTYFVRLNVNGTECSVRPIQYFK